MTDDPRNDPPPDPNPGPPNPRRHSTDGHPDPRDHAPGRRRPAGHASDAPMRYQMLGGADPALDQYMGVVGWEYLAPHFETGALLWVDPSLDLQEVGAALVADNTQLTRQWLRRGDLVKPSQPHADHWANSAAPFRALVVSPFVLIQPATTGRPQEDSP